MYKVFARLSLVFLTGIAFFSALGCNFFKDEPTARIVTVSLDLSTLEEVYERGEFSLDTVYIIVHKEGNVTERIPLNETMISEGDLAKLLTIGTHTITVSYQGFEVTFDIEIALFSELNIILEALYTLGVSEGLIDTSYEEWLEAIRGEDGRGIIDVYLNTHGELIVVYSDGIEENIGQLLTFHVVTFIDHDGTLLHVEAVLSGYSAIGPIAPNRLGYVFTGWNQSLLEISEDLSVQAEYQLKEVAITFNTGGGTEIEPLVQGAFTTVVPPNDPRKSGYHFGGWFIDNTLKTPFVFTEMLPEDFILYARWIKRLNVNDLRDITSLNNYRMEYEKRIDEELVLSYLKMKDNVFYDLEYRNLATMNDVHHDLKLQIGRLEGARFAIFEVDQGGCSEQVSLTAAKETEMLALFADSTLLPNALENHWFERDDDLYQLKSDYFVHYLQAVMLNAETHTLLYYHIRHSEEGFMIEVGYQAGEEKVEKVFVLDRIGMTDVTMSAQNLCDATYFGLNYDITPEGAVITGYQGFASSVVVPNQIDGVTVIAIGEQAFEESVIKTIHISDDVIEIGDLAFNNATSLEEVTFGAESKLKKLGENAFANAHSLHTIVLPDSVDEVGMGAFFNSYSLHFFILPKSLTYIPSSMFAQSSLNMITIHENITIIGQYAFYGCSDLGHIEFSPDGQLTTIETEAFAYTNLSQLFLPDTLTTIQMLAFSYTTLSGIHIPNSVLHMGDLVFLGNAFSFTVYTSHSEAPPTWNEMWNSTGFSVEWGWNFTVHTILDDLENITNYQEALDVEGALLPYVAFNYSQTLERAHYYKLLEGIPQSEYYVSTHELGFLRYVYQSEHNCWSVEFISEEEFNREKIPISLPLFLDRSFNASWFTADFTTITLKESYFDEVASHLNLLPTTIEITLYQVRRVSGGYQVRIEFSYEEEIMEIYYYIWKINQTTIHVPTSNFCELPIELQWSFSISEGEATLLNYLDEQTEVIIPSSIGGFPVTTIADNALAGREFITKVTIPSSVTTIGSLAFALMESLNEVIFEEGSSLAFIGEMAFFAASSLEMFVIPSTVTMIESHAFVESPKIVFYTELMYEDTLWENWNYDNRPVVYGYIPTDIVPTYVTADGAYGLLVLYDEDVVGDFVVVDAIVYATHTDGYFLIDWQSVMISVSDPIHTFVTGDKVQVIGYVGTNGSLVEIVGVVASTHFESDQPIALHSQSASTVDLYMIFPHEYPSYMGKLYYIHGYVYVDAEDNVFIGNYSYEIDDYGFQYTYCTDYLVKLSPFTDPEKIALLRGLEGKFVSMHVHFLGQVDDTIHVFFMGELENIFITSPILTHDDYAYLFDIAQPLHNYMVIGTVIAVFGNEYILFDGVNMLHIHVHTGGVPKVGDYVRTIGEYGLHFNTYKLFYSSSFILIEENVPYTLTPEVITLEALLTLTEDDVLAHGRYYRITGTVSYEPSYNLPVLTDGTHTVLIGLRSPMSSLELLYEYDTRTITIDVFLYSTKHWFIDMVELIFTGDASDIIEGDEPYGNLIARFEFNDEHTNTYNDEIITYPFTNVIDYTSLNFLLYRTAVERSHWVMYSTDALTLSPRIGTGYTGEAWAELNFEDTAVKTLVFETYFWHDDVQSYFNLYELQVWDDVLETWVLHTNLLPYIYGKTGVVAVVIRDLNASRFRFYAEGGAPGTNTARILIDNVRIYETPE